MNIEEIQKVLPQRYPFLFIDRVVTFEKDKKLVAIKNVTYNEEFFKGHFPKRSVTPGVLLIEAMGQAGILFLMLNKYNSIEDVDENDVYFLYSVKARFFKPTGPGDQLVIEVAPVKITNSSGIIKATVKIDGKEAARAEIIGAKQK